MRDEDQGCVERSVEGDREAFETLVRRYQRMIYSLAYRMTGSATDAEDLVQETFIRAYQQLGGFCGEARFSSWLYRIAVNHCLNWRKRVIRREQVQQQWLADCQTESAAADALAQRVQGAPLKLSPKQSAAVVLTTYDGLSHAAAARGNPVTVRIITIPR